MKVQVQKLTIFRTDVEPWEEHDVSELVSGSFEPSAGADYAVVASRSCRCTTELKGVFGMQTSRYLLPRGKLLFWDHDEFGAQCVFSNEFVPAVLSYVPTERAVTAIAAKYPRVSTYANQTYRKGVALAKVGRTEDAEAMLAKGDAEPNSGGETGENVRFDFNGPEAVPVDQGSYRAGLRAELVKAIATAKTGVRP